MTTASDATRERILEAAETVFGDKGYHDAIVDDIGRATSISKGGLYFHFPNKEALFFAVMDRLADRLVQRAEKAAAGQTSPLASAEAALEAVLTSLSKRRRLARLLIVQGYSMGNSFERKRAEVFDRFAAVIRVQLARAVSSGEIRPVDTHIAARVWLGAISEVIIHWLYDGGESPVQSLPTIKRLLTVGLALERAGR